MVVLLVVVVVVMGVVVVMVVLVVLVRVAVVVVVVGVVFVVLVLVVLNLILTNWDQNCLAQNDFSTNPSTTFSSFVGSKQNSFQAEHYRPKSCFRLIIKS